MVVLLYELIPVAVVTHENMTWALLVAYEKLIREGKSTHLLRVVEV